MKVWVCFLKEAPEILMVFEGMVMEERETMRLKMWIGKQINAS